MELQSQKDCHSCGGTWHFTVNTVLILNIPNDLKPRSNTEKRLFNLVSFSERVPHFNANYLYCSILADLHNIFLRSPRERKMKLTIDSYKNFTGWVWDTSRQNQRHSKVFNMLCLCKLLWEVCQYEINCILQWRKMGQKSEFVQEFSVGYNR